MTFYLYNIKLIICLVLAVCFSVSTLSAQSIPGTYPDTLGLKASDNTFNLDSIGNIIDSLNNLLLRQIQTKNSNLLLYNQNMAALVKNFSQSKVVANINVMEQLQLNEIKIKKIEDLLKKSVKSYYGQNDVTNMTIAATSVIPEEVIEAAKCVCAIIHKDYLKETNNGYILTYSTLKEREIRINGSLIKLCDHERFLDQINPAIGTAWSYKDNLIVTAKHCFTAKNLMDYRFVFDFFDSNSKDIISKDRVFQPLRKVNINPEDSAMDFMIIQVNTNIPPSRYARLESAPSGIIQKKVTKLYMIGHPLGLPLKYTPNGQVEDLTDYVLKTNLDAYAGNSGSPVFNSKSNKVVGILLSGNQDFNVTASNCCESVPYPLNYPMNHFGENVLRIINFLQKY